MRDYEGSKKSSNNFVNSGGETEKQEAVLSGGFGGWLKKKASSLHGRFEHFQTWWQKTKGKSEAKHDKTDAQDTSTAPPKMEPAFARAAGLVLWAPTAVLLAPIGAALITVFVVWLVRPTYVDNGKVISLASFASSILVLLVWFSTTPRFGATLRRFGYIIGALIVVMGIYGLVLAGSLTVSYFFGGDMFLGLPFPGLLR